MEQIKTSRGFDTYLNCANHVDDIVAADIDFIMRYYDHTSNYKVVLTNAEAKVLSAKKRYIGVIWENGRPDHVGYFSAAKGHADAVGAFKCASDVKQPFKTPIFAAADYDAAESDFLILDAYFETFKLVLQKLGDYEVGVYGNGILCAHLKAKGFVDKTWLTQSAGHRGHHDWLSFADIVQGPQDKFHNLDIDHDEAHGNSGCWLLP